MFLFALMSFRHDILGLLIVANYLIYCCLYASTTKLKNFSLKKPNIKKLFSRNGMFFFNLALKPKTAITNFIPVFSLQVFFWRLKLHSLVLKSVFFKEFFQFKIILRHCLGRDMSYETFIDCDIVYAKKVNRLITCLNSYLPLPLVL